MGAATPLVAGVGGGALAGTALSTAAVGGLGISTVAGPAFMTLGSGTFKGMLAQGANPLTAMGFGGLSSGLGSLGWGNSIMGLNTLMGMNTALQQGEMAQQMHEYNIQIQEQQLKLEQETLEIEKERHKRAIYKLRGEMKALAGRSGFDYSGTWGTLGEELDIAEERGMIELDTQSRRKEWAIRAGIGKERLMGETAMATAQHKARTTLVSGSADIYKLRTYGLKGGLI